MVDFDLVLDRRDSNSAKWDRYAGRDILPMWVADMDFRVPQQIIDAIKERADHGVFGYDSISPELKEVIMQRMQMLYDWQVQADEIIFLTGVVSGLNQACRALVNPDESIITATPIYFPFLKAPENWHRQLHRIPSSVSGGLWSFPVDPMSAYMAENPDIKLLTLCNPYNPIGRLLNEQELNRIVDICQRNNVWICSDEIHCELVLDDRRHIPTATISAEAEAITVTLMAPTKTFNLAGLGGSFAIIKNPELRSRFVRGGSGMTGRITTFGLISMLVAYRDCEPWRMELLQYLKNNRDYLAGRISLIPGISMSPVEATYLAWLDVSALDLAEPMSFFESAGVGLSDGPQFDGPQYMRLNFACPMKTLEEACDRIEGAVSCMPVAS